MSFGSSDSKSVQENITENYTSNEQISFSGIDGHAISGDVGGDLTIDATSPEAFKMAERMFAEGMDFGGEAIFGMESVSRAALDVGESVTANAMETMRLTNQSALDFGGEAFDLVRDTFVGATKQIADVSQSAVSAAITATRSDNAETLNTLTKYGFIAVGAIVLGMAYFGTKGK